MQQNTNRIGFFGVLATLSGVGALVMACFAAVTPILAPLHAAPAQEPEAWGVVAFAAVAFALGLLGLLRREGPGALIGAALAGVALLGLPLFAGAIVATCFLTGLTLVGRVRER